MNEDTAIGGKGDRPSALVRRPVRSHSVRTER